MTIDKKRLYASSATLLLVLLVAMFLPTKLAKAVSALLLIAFAVVIRTTLKKRTVLSINKREVLLLISAISGVWLVLYYLSGMHFGFYKNLTPLSVETFFTHLLPGIIIIVSTELIRYVLLAQNQRAVNVITYVIGVLSEMIILYPIASITTFNRFMSAVGGTLFPAITANALYNHVSKRYGSYPNIVFRLVTTMYIFVLPAYPSTPDSLFAFAKVLVPLFILAFLRMLYEKKKYFVPRRSKIAVRICAVILTLATTLMMMLISCKFRYRAIVIATESMTGEINKGDSVVYERYDDQLITEGQVIVFQKFDKRFVHRVVKIERINNQTIYYTKGDANDALDSGFISETDIEGVVLFKIAYLGYPSIWLHDLFK